MAYSFSSSALPSLGRSTTNRKNRLSRGETVKMPLRTRVNWARTIASVAPDARPAVGCMEYVVSERQRNRSRVAARHPAAGMGSPLRMAGVVRLILVRVTCHDSSSSYTGCISSITACRGRRDSAIHPCSDARFLASSARPIARARVTSSLSALSRTTVSSSESLSKIMRRTAHLGKTSIALSARCSWILLTGCSRLQSGEGMFADPAGYGASAVRRAESFNSGAILPSDLAMTSFLDQTAIQWAKKGLSASSRHKDSTTVSEADPVSPVIRDASQSSAVRSFSYIPTTVAAIIGSGGCA